MTMNRPRIHPTSPKRDGLRASRQKRQRVRLRCPLLVLTLCASLLKTIHLITAIRIPVQLPFLRHHHLRTCRKQALLYPTRRRVLVLAHSPQHHPQLRLFCSSVTRVDLRLLPLTCPNPYSFLSPRLQDPPLNHKRHGLTGMGTMPGPIVRKRITIRIDLPHRQLRLSLLLPPKEALIWKAPSHLLGNIDRLTVRHPDSGQSRAPRWVHRCLP